jgi:uncharacterized Fe-S cluster protein YjdI
VTEEREYTVVGMWWESAERWQDQFVAASPVMAETLAHELARSRGLHLAVCGVYEGALVNVDTYPWVDPSASSQAEMDQLRAEVGYDDRGSGG